MHNLEQNTELFLQRGWCHFEYDQAIADWVNAALLFARKAVKAEKNTPWLRCQGTWFVGVNVLPNREDGSIGEGPVLQGNVVDFVRQTIGCDKLAWDPAQVSVVYPGYPKPRESESEKAFDFRRRRDAAHVDGLLPEGPLRRRHLREYHSFILGVPMVEYDASASPCVVWEGSHELVRSAMLERFTGLDADRWCDEDITEAYHAVRNQIFKQCHRIELVAKPGEAYLLHRLALHGISPWLAGTEAAGDGRMICYFRPQFAAAWEWLSKP